ncbi:MAG: hypothetical protein CL868_11170 [Cytophagaceae bacterium]|nr:hypothetical protein [Cytophagaceae bacterium]|tara:strand:+ start:9918 stop:12314 length:2397 start_codon:yes stop_codon:yes gene_type:complete
MIRNYIKIAWRNLQRNKLYGFINIGGLALGLCACLLILFFVGHEKSYDTFHTDADRIFSMRASFKMGDNTMNMQAFNSVVGTMVQENSPAVEATVRMNNMYEPVVVGNRQFTGAKHAEKNFSFADANFFEFFSFDLLQGEKDKVLKKPYSLVISRKMARKYFGESQPIGQTLEVKIDSVYTFTVTGIAEDTRSNSTIQTDFIASLNSMRTIKKFDRDFEYSSFRGGSFPTFVKLKDSGTEAQVVKTINELSKQASEEADETYSLMNITQKHLTESSTGQSKYLKVFPLIALLIVLLALINYLSLSTARASLRAKEIGVRKVNGASRKSVALQFYVESTLYVVLAFFLAIVLTAALQSYFFDLLNIEIDTSFFLNGRFLITLGVLFMITVILTGLYPAVLMSSFNPIDNLRSKFSKKTGGITLRQTCTVVQFIIAVGLIISGLIIQQQINFMRNVDIGLNRSNVLMLPLQNTIGTNSTAFRNEVASLPQVQQTAVARQAMYRGYDIFFASSDGKNDDVALPIFSIDEHFLKTLQVQWKIKPEDLSRLSGEKTIIINTTTIKEFGLSPNPIGEKIHMGVEDYEIVGVTKDFNFSSLDAPIQPLALFTTSESNANTELLSARGGCIYVRFSPKTNLQNMLAKIEDIYAKYDKESPFEYEFMDDAFDATFRSEQRLAYIFNIFIVLTFVIAGMGLFGLATFTAQQKFKEIGIRKVLGASVYQITSLLSLGFLKLVCIAILIASPLAWYFMRDWLQDFTYRTQIEWWVFLLAGTITLFITILTVGFETIRAAMANPVKSLRSE